jgi:hypothetical protein
LSRHVDGHDHWPLQIPSLTRDFHVATLNAASNALALLNMPDGSAFLTLMDTETQG